MILDKRKVKGAKRIRAKIMPVKLCNRLLLKISLEIKKILIESATVIP
jgi:hypothetical protein|tara:strand:- start:783 stop:926 length:144 start_codon:yes stop_codon:yes gene_type:complete